MKYLNLTEGFNPYNQESIPFESFIFNGGEPHIKIDLSRFSNEELENVIITSRATSMNDLMLIMLAADALNQSGDTYGLFLFIPYFPGTRQDRKMVEGEPLTIKVMANMINYCEFKEVITFDNHSDVSTALIENCTNLDNHKFVDTCIVNIYPEDIKDYKKYHLISPDAGSNKKIINLAKSIGSDSVIKCDKTRDVANGNITGFEVYSDDLNGKDCIIVDDICDGGGTFIGLAKELKKKNAGDIYLIVSHGIFSKPLKGLKPYFKKIYTTDSWRSEFGWEQVERDSTDLVEIVEFNEFL